MKYFIYIAVFAFISCAGKKNETQNNSIDTLALNRDSKSAPNDSTTTSNDTIQQTKVDKDLIKYSQQVIHAIKELKTEELANYISPVEGVRLSPYGYIDKKNDIILSKAELNELWTTSSKIKKKWGSYDGSGEPIKMTIKEYFKRFVYDVDFEKAPNISTNACLGGGNSQNNISEVYDGCEYVEYYFEGFDQKYEGMDWKALRLVYKKQEGSYFLVGIVHDEWTI